MTTPEQPGGKPPEQPKRGGKRQPPHSPVDTDEITEKISSSGRTVSERILESEQETASRLRIKEADADAARQKKLEDAGAIRTETQAEKDHRRFLEKIALVVFLAICGVVTIGCLWVLRDKTIAPQDKAWVGPTLTLVIGSVGGYMTGRFTGKSPER